MALPQLPIIQQSKDQIVDEAMERRGPPQQLNMDLGGSQDKTAQMDYWRDAQDYSMEIRYITALCEGKTSYIADDGSIKFDFPKDETGKYIKAPFCNAEGRAWIVGFVAPFLQKGTTLSSYSIETALDRCDITAETLNETLEMNMRTWAIDGSKLGATVDMIMDRIEAAKRRAVNDAERGFVGKAVSIIEQITGGLRQQNQGIGGLLLPKSRV